MTAATWARAVAFLAAAIVVLVTSAPASAEMKPVRVGSKRFVESYILAEIVAEMTRAEGATAEHDQGLGGTAVVFRAVEDGRFLPRCSRSWSKARSGSSSAPSCPVVFAERAKQSRRARPPGALR